jgi:PIN domain nuclease of toxin-antitoxin system
MDLLLDTHILLGFLEEELGAPLREALALPEHELYASVASLWETAIKVRLGKLALEGPLEGLPELIAAADMTLLSINAAHVLAVAEPVAATRDPFDRLLLAQCAVEHLQLVTTDRALVSHPLAWRES